MNCYQFNIYQNYILLHFRLRKKIKYFKKFDIGNVLFINLATVSENHKKNMEHIGKALSRHWGEKTNIHKFANNKCLSDLKFRFVNKQNKNK